MYVLLAGVGLIFGSFASATVWRLKSGESITRGRSMCPNCKHTLSAPDLVPLFSWLILRGRCRYCHQVYGAHYVLVEAATALVFVLSGWMLNSLGAVALALWLALAVCLIILALYDAQWYVLPNSVMHPALVLGLIYFVLRFEAPGSLLQLAWAVAVAGVFYSLWRLSDGHLMGGADSKLVLLMGLILAPMLLVAAVALAFMLGGVVAAFLLLRKRKGLKDQIAFGPYLIVALFVMQLFGVQLLRLLGF